MTYALKVRDAARTSLDALPFDLQEGVWDLLDQIVREPGEADGSVRPEATAHRVIVRFSGGNDVGARLGIAVDHEARVVYLLAVGLEE